MFNRNSGRARGFLIVAAVGATALMIAPASGMAAKVKFGSKLNPTVQPSNSLPAQDCQHQDPGKSCTLVMNEAYGRPNGGEKAPVNGILKRVRVIAGGKGHFRLQLTKARKVNGTWEAKAVRNGPLINYSGQKQSNFNSDHYKVESFKVGIPIFKGERLSMRATKTSAIRCSSGGDNTLIFVPPLLEGGGFKQAKSTDGCWPLIEGVIKK
jgi:hypothetical protein